MSRGCILSVLGFCLEESDADYCLTCNQGDGVDDKFWESASGQADEASGQVAAKVSFVKGRDNECAKCWYVRRGSFKKTSQVDLNSKIAEHPPVEEKWTELRRAQVQIAPGKKKPRHELVDLTYLTKKTEESFVQLYTDGEFVPLKAYCDELKKNNKFKNDAQRQRFVEEQCHCKVITDPESGKLGVCVAEERGDGRKRMRMGSRMASVRERVQAHASKESAATVHQRQAAKHTGKVMSMTEAGVHLPLRR